MNVPELSRLATMHEECGDQLHLRRISALVGAGWRIDPHA